MFVLEIQGIKYHKLYGKFVKLYRLNAVFALEKSCGEKTNFSLKTGNLSLSLISEVLWMGNKVYRRFLITSSLVKSSPRWSSEEIFSETSLPQSFPPESCFARKFFTIESS
jgi:hypothetical protein